MPEKLGSNPDTQKHFDILTTEVRKIIKSFNEDRSGMTTKHWQQILKKLPQKILKAQNITTVDALKKFIEVKEHLPQEELQKLKEQCLKHSCETILWEKIYTISPDDAIQILLTIARTGEDNIVFYTWRYFDYLKDSKNVKELLDAIAQKSPNELLKHFYFLRGMPDSFYFFKNLVARIADIDKALQRTKFEDHPTFEDHLSSLKFNEAQKEEIIAMTQSKRERLALLKGIMWSDNGVNNAQDLSKDPALENINAIKSEWIISVLKQNLPEFEEINIGRWVSMVARNLFFQKKEINEGNTAQETHRIIKVRKELAGTPLFKKRNILFAAHTEKNETEGNFFWKKTVISALEKQGGKVDFQRPENEDEETVLKKKAEVLRKFETTRPPFVFIFDGHGQQNGLHFTGWEAPGVRWEKKSEINISAQELVEAYKERLKNFPELQSAPLAQRDYLIFNTCFGHDFLRNFYDGLPAEANKPVTIASAEFGQVAYSLENNDYENDFFEKTLDLKNPDSVTTFEDVFQWDEKEEASNPSLYVPDDNNRPMHLSQNNDDTNTGVA